MAPSPVPLKEEVQLHAKNLPEADHNEEVDDNEDDEIDDAEAPATGMSLTDGTLRLL